MHVNAVLVVVVMDAKSEALVLEEAHTWTDSCGSTYKISYKNTGDTLELRGVSDTLSLSKLMFDAKICARVLFEKQIISFEQRDAPAKNVPKREGDSEIASKLDSSAAGIPLEAKKALKPIVTQFVEAITTGGALRVYALSLRAAFDGDVAKVTISGLKTISTDDLAAATQAGANKRLSFVNMRAKAVTLAVTVAAEKSRGVKRSRDDDS